MNEECKSYECYMFACDSCNILIEADSKWDAIEVFEEEFGAKFSGDWKIFRINTKIDIAGEFNRY